MPRPKKIENVFTGALLKVIQKEVKHLSKRLAKVEKELDKLKAKRRKKKAK